MLDGMDVQQIKTRLVELYPAFESMPPKLLDETVSQAVVRQVPAGTVMFDEKNPCQAFPMLLNGSIRVTKTGANGRELQLYRVVPGESCILSSSCLLGGSPYPARGIAESEVTVVALTAPVFNRLVAEHEPFRNYVFSLFSERIADLLQLVDAVAFQKLDQRLAALLLGKGKTIHTTHQALADELGSVREIVSRLLKNFAEQGLVSLGREQIEIMDAARLRRVAAPA
jgi:CRP/FNR family transcriptional regulator